MENGILIKVFVITLVVLFYTAWRKYAAYKGRQAMAESLDVFLAGDAPKEMKDFVFKFFHISLFGFFSPLVLLNIVFSKRESDNKQESSLAEEVNKASEQQKDHFKSLFGMGLIVVFKRAPITTFICLIILLASAIIQALVDKFTFQGSIISIESSLEKAANHYRY